MLIRKHFKWLYPLVMVATLALGLPVQAGIASASASVPAPVFSFPNGASNNQGMGYYVTISDTAGGDPIYYTTDGSNPETSYSATRYTGGIEVNHSETVQAVARDPVNGWSDVVSATFTITGVLYGTEGVVPPGQWSAVGDLSWPSISPNGAGGAFSSPVSVTISDTASGDPIYYTTDDSNPETSSTRTLYTGAFTVSQSGTVEAAVYDNEFGWEGPGLDTFHINGSSSLQTPIIDPAGGAFTTTQKVTIDGVFAGETAYYTTDGSNPTSSGTAILYTGMINVSQSETLQAAIHDPVNGWSSVASATFTISSDAPVISPDGGSYTTPQSVTISGIPSGDTAYYTTDGSNPEQGSTRIAYTGPFTVSQSETVNAANKDEFNNWGSMASDTFTINSSSTLAPGSTAPAVTTTAPLPSRQNAISFTVGRNSYTAGGQSFVMDGSPFISKGRLLVPVRYLADALGAQINWDADTQAATVSTSVYQIQTAIGSTTMMVNGQPQTMDVVPLINNGRTYLSARFVAEAFGSSVSWDEATQTVTVSPPSI